MSAAAALAGLRAAGVRVWLDGNGVVAMDASAPPAADLLPFAGRHRAGIAALLREAETFGTPGPDHTEPDRLAALHAATLAGSQRAALCRPTSWGNPAVLPSPGCRCSCCDGRRWWTERVRPMGWRCWACHPPDHFSEGDVCEVRT